MIWKSTFACLLEWEHVSQLYIHTIYPGYMDKNQSAIGKVVLGLKYTENIDITVTS